MTQPRVVVVEDDETLAEFFSMVLEMLPVEPFLCRSAEEALSILRQAPADVLVTDLLLPGLDGRGLLKTLRAEPGLRGAARLVVMSGSIDDVSRRELSQLGVWRVLGKPVTVKAFRSCIEEALGEAAPANPEGDRAAVQAQPLSPAQQAIVESHFAGNEPLFLAYRHGSVQQFPRDIEQGDRALATGDLAGLRRVAHNLKSVLRTLACAELAQVASGLEDEAAKRLGPRPTGPADSSRSDADLRSTALEVPWQQLRAGLQALVGSGGR